MGQFGLSSSELRLSPELSRGLDRNDFKVDEVIPVADPSLEQFRIRCFHDLEAPDTRRIHPARVVGDAFGQHSATQLEPFADGTGIAMFEAFDDHEEHEAECTSD